MRRIRTAVIGAGFMGRVHTEAIRRLGNVEVVAVVANTQEEASAFASSVCVDAAYNDFDAVLRDRSIEAVHICTPNVLHASMSKAALRAGKAVLCEKPLTMTSEEARELVDLAKRTGLPNAVNHNLRFYPAIQQMRRMIASGQLGEILVVQGTYSQDWLLYDTDWNWRLESKWNGPLRATGDIGSHWMDTVQHVTGLPITSLCADLDIIHKQRKKPKKSVQTFAGKRLSPDDYDVMDIDTEDYGAVMLRLGDRARGAFTVSQCSAGCKNRFQVEIYGSKAGVQWNQERQDELWVGHRNEPNQVILKDPSLMDPEAATYADLPGGHSEGYDDTHKQNFRRFYRHVADRETKVEYPTFADGLRGMILLEKIIESNRTRSWVEVGASSAAV